MRIVITFLLTLLLSMIYVVKGEQTPLTVGHLNVKDGLSNNFVTDIVQDKRGFLWIATDAGLNRFDGINFKLFNEKNSQLNGNSLNALFYDDLTDKLWIGTKKGLNIFNCTTQEMEKSSLCQSNLLYNVVDITRAADGGIWLVNHYDNFVHYNTADNSIEIYNNKNTKGLPISFRTLYDDGKGNLFVGHAQQGLSIINLKTREVKNMRHIPGDINSIPGNDVKCVFIDRFNNTWIGTDKGLALLNPVSMDFITFKHSNLNLNSIIADNIYAITEMDDSSLWIGSDIGGLSILDLRNLTFSNSDRLQFKTLPVTKNKQGLSSTNIRSIFQDCFGNIWIGNYSEGLDFISRTQPIFQMLPYFEQREQYTINKSVWSTCADKDGKIWIGGENEIVLFQNGKIKRIYDLAPYLTKKYAQIVSLVRFGDDLVFSPYENGLFSLNIKNGIIRRLVFEENNNHAYSLYNVGDSLILVGETNGLYEYKNGKYKKLIKQSQIMNNLIPNGIVYDNQGNLWVGSYGKGVFIFDKEGNLLNHLESGKGFCSNAIKHLYLDSRGWIWIAGQDGLGLVKETSTPLNFSTYGYNSGLEDTHIRAIQEDTAGNIWLSTNNGLTRWNHITGKLENYDYYNGLPQSNFVDRASCRTSDGHLCFGSLNGICYFKPEHLLENNKEIPVQIVECQNISTSDLINSNLIYPFDVQGNITIPYVSNSLRIIFSVPDYSQSQLVEYAYIVDGLDGSWTITDRGHQAIIRNLPPGKYKFKVKARLRNQEWNDNNIATASITVTPPLWLTWYAKSLYIVMIIVILFMIFKFYNHKLLLKNSLEFERRKSIDEQQLNNERLRFYTNITHELRTPLTLILGPLEDLVSDTYLTIPYKNRIKTIHASALRLLSLINQILEFRKMETQNRKLTVAKSDLSNLVTEIGLRYKELNRNDKVIIELVIEPQISDVYFDSDVVHTILNNLLSNAVKYTPEGKITLRLKTTHEDMEEYIEQSVADTGYGIDSKILPHIFDRYYQVEGKHQASGTGIGLALVKSISELHEGELLVESEIGKGTVFKFRIKRGNTYPNALHKEPVIPSTEGIIACEIEDENSDKRSVVLVVEDNDDIREYIESSLNSKYQIITASNGQSGVELAKKTIPDVIVSDIMMPIMDGIELCKNIKSDLRTSHVPVIILTAKDSIQDKEVGYEIGADSYLTKPFSAKLLGSRIHNILESRKLLASIITSNTQSKNITTGEEQNINAGDPPLKLSKLDETFLAKFTRIVEDNLTMPGLDMAYMQESLNMSHSTLYRKIKGLTGISGNEFIRRIKLRKGYELLKEGYNVSEAAYSCGFNDVGYFRNCFKDEYEVSPTQFIKSL